MSSPVITVAIIGAGPLGRGLAFRAARAGFRVILEDVMPSSLRHAEEALRESLGPAAMPLAPLGLVTIVLIVTSSSRNSANIPA